METDQLSGKARMLRGTIFGKSGNPKALFEAYGLTAGHIEKICKLLAK